MGNKVVERLGNALTRFAMADEVENLEKIMDRCLRTPAIFKACFKMLPEYKRNAIIDLINSTKDEG